MSTLSGRGKQKSIKAVDTDQETIFSGDSSHCMDIQSDLHEDLVNMVKYIRKNTSDLKKLKISGGGYSTKQVMPAR